MGPSTRKKPGNYHLFLGENDQKTSKLSYFLRSQWLQTCLTNTDLVIDAKNEFE